MKRVFLPLIAFFCVSVFAAPLKESKIQWTPIGEAWAKLGKTDKPLFVYVTSNGCGWCTKFWNETLTDPEIEKTLSDKFIFTKVNLSSRALIDFDGQQKEERAVGAMFNVRGTPHSIFVNGKQEIIGRLPGYTPASDFKVVLKYISEKWYETMKFEDFVASEKKLADDKAKTPDKK